MNRMDRTDRTDFKSNRDNEDRLHRDDQDEDLLREQGYMTERGLTFDRVKTTVADFLYEAADVIHHKSLGTGSSEISNFGDRAANWLEHSAGYVREMEPQQLKSDIEDKVRRHPGRSLIIAGAVGLVLGSMLRRR
jgi:hypothetical protein